MNTIPNTAKPVIRYFVTLQGGVRKVFATRKEAAAEVTAFRNFAIETRLKRYVVPHIDEVIVWENP